MGFIVMTGRARAVEQAVFDAARRAHMQGEAPLLFVVPAQYTLQAELKLLRQGAEGSFRLQVLSPSRLYARVFDQAGWPSGARIDEQGRVMLVHAAAERLKKQLKWYGGAVGRRGFAEKVLAQLEGFKQARVNPEQLKEMAGTLPDGALSKKLADLALLYEGYEQALAGRFLDGEDEARAAASRMGEAALVRGAEVFVYGFDIVSATLAETLVALSQYARSVTLALTLDEDGRDRDLFVPVKRSLARLGRLATEQGVRLERLAAPGPENLGTPDIRHLERELYCIPLNPYKDAPRAIQLAALKNPQDEAEFAAALVRQQVMRRGWRWRDVAVGCQSLDETYMDALRRAFAQADVPLFLPTSRPADRHPAAAVLLSALRLIARGWQTHDMVDHLRTGYTVVDDDQADLLVNHILRRGLRGRRLKEAFEGLPEDQAELESARVKVVEPLLALEQKTQKERDTRLVLAAIFEFLERLCVRERIEAQQEALIELGQREWAMEGAQVWNRILLALDQMHELLGDERLSLREAGELLQRSLSVSEVKPLPQSGDAVLCGGIDHMKSQPVKALLVLGLSDVSAPSDAGLLSEPELTQLGGQELSSALSPQDRLRMQRLNLKSALSFVDSYLFLSYPASDAKGAALKKGVLIQQIRRVLPDLPERGGLSGEQSLLRVRLNAPEAARNRLPAMLREARDDPFLEAVQQALGDEVKGNVQEEAERLPPRIAERLFGQIAEVSVSRLERYAKCPYQHFAHYALRPEEFHEFSLTPRDTGTFFHDAMEAFIRENGNELGEISEQQSMERMDDVTNQLILRLTQQALGEGALARAQGEELRQVARRAAATVVNQLEGSQFAPTGLEIDFGQAGPGITLGDGARLGGRIDRVDGWQDGERKYLRVIDYKTGGKTLSLQEIYYGLQMQLMVYMAAVTKQQAGRPAGAFFFNLSDKPVDTPSRDPQQVERERQKALKLKGLALKDEAVTEAMAKNPEAVLPVRGDNVVSAQDFDLLIGHTLRKAEQVYGRLRSGEIQAKPSALGTGGPCEYCDFKALCQRDPAQKAEKLPSLKGREVLDLIRAEQE